MIQDNPYRNMPANEKKIKLCIDHAHTWAKHWGDYIIGSEVTLSFVGDCVWCIADRNERCPTCNHFMRS